MEFSAFATIIIALGSAFISAVVTAVITVYKMTSRFITVDACRLLVAEGISASDGANQYVTARGCEKDRHTCERFRIQEQEVENEKVEDIKKMIQALKESNDIQYQMLRALVVHMPITKEAQEMILNKGNGK